MVDKNGDGVIDYDEVVPRIRTQGYTTHIAIAWNLWFSRL
jgi:hypothetical protein